MARYSCVGEVRRCIRPDLDLYIGILPIRLFCIHTSEGRLPKAEVMLITVSTGGSIKGTRSALLRALLYPICGNDDSRGVIEETSVNTSWMDLGICKDQFLLVSSMLDCNKAGLHSISSVGCKRRSRIDRKSPRLPGS